MLGRKKMYILSDFPALGKGLFSYDVSQKWGAYRPPPPTPYQPKSEEEKTPSPLSEINFFALIFIK